MVGFGLRNTATINIGAPNELRLKKPPNGVCLVEGEHPNESTLELIEHLQKAFNTRGISVVVEKLPLECSLWGRIDELKKHGKYLGGFREYEDKSRQLIEWIHDRVSNELLKISRKHPGKLVISLHSTPPATLGFKRPPALKNISVKIYNEKPVIPTGDAPVIIYPHDGVSRITREDTSHILALEVMGIFRKIPESRAERAWLARILHKDAKPLIRPYVNYETDLEKMQQHGLISDKMAEKIVEAIIKSFEE
ncbi:MAG: hypothetical protein QW343_00220 [Candidatus Norongarragalinales archaeon]